MTNPDANEDRIDFAHFHRDTLPLLAAGGRGGMAARAARGLRPLALRVAGGSAFTYVPRDEAVEVVDGDDTASTVLELEQESWQGLVRELEAPAGLLYSGRVRCLRGEAIDLMAWEPAIRALYSGIPLYEPDRIELRDSSGASLDPERVFAATSDDGEMKHFLRVCGYVFLRGLLSPDEIGPLLAEIAELRAEARKGDRFSWWGKSARGEEILCRVTRAASKPRLGALPADPRLLRLRDLGEEPLVHVPGEGNGVTVIFKTPDMVEGLSDIPWHRDCGMGGHALNCPTLIASIYLTEATPETGELMMLPGSRGTTFNAHATAPSSLRPARFRARAGDVSLHYSDTVHAAPPPIRSDLDTYRVSAILSFGRPGARHHRGERSYNAALHRRDDGQIEHLEKVARSESPARD